MNAAVLVWKNLGRNKSRSILTVGAVALPMAMLVFSLSVREVLVSATRNASQTLRLAVHHRTSIMNPIPIRIRGLVESMDPDRKVLKSVCSMSFFAGQVENAPPYQFPSICVDADSFPDVFSEYEVRGEDRKAWEATRNAACVGVATAENYGWKKGDEVELRSAIPPYLRLRFKIVMVNEKGFNPAVMWVRRDYVSEALRSAKAPDGLVNILWLKCHKADDMASFAKRIDEATKDTPDETVTQDESTFFAGFMKMMGDLPNKILFIAAAVVAAIVMVAANTMSLSFRERVRELAVFKSLGFPHSWIVRVVMAESIGLCLLGGLVGTVPPYLITQAIPIKEMGFGPMKRFMIPGSEVGIALAVSLFVGIVAGLYPAIAAGRIRPAVALRRTA